MRGILREFNENAGVDGSMVITPDGIMVAAALREELDEDAVAAFAASLLIAIKRGLAKLKVPTPLHACTLTGTAGRLMFFDMENSYLVAVAPVGTRLSFEDEAVQEAIHKIKNRRVA